MDKYAYEVDGVGELEIVLDFSDLMIHIYDDDTNDGMKPVGLLDWVGEEVNNYLDEQFPCGDEDFRWFAKRIMSVFESVVVRVAKDLEIHRMKMGFSQDTLDFISHEHRLLPFDDGAP